MSKRSRKQASHPHGGLSTGKLADEKNRKSKISKINSDCPSAQKIFVEKEVERELREELECPICLEYCTRPRECLACSRLFCAPCIAHLTSCPLCRKEPFVTRDSRLASRLVDNVQVKCEQCDAEVIRSRLEEHKKMCEKRFRKCSFENCGFFATTKEEASDHLKTVHMDQMSDNFENLRQIFSTIDDFTFAYRYYSSILESGKALVCTVIGNNEQSDFSCGWTRTLGEKKKDVMDFKFKPIHLSSNRLKFGIIRDKNAARNKTRRIIALTMDAKMVKIEQIDKEEENSVETLSERKVPNIPALPEFEMEVNTIFRTIRFLICGEQVHDGDIAIPWTRADLDDMVFCVWLYKTGDCVRIID